MDLSERPLIEMMNWSQGGREGRFLLRNELLYQGQQQKKAKRTKKAPKNRKTKRSRDRSSSNVKIDEPSFDSTGDDGSFVDVLYDNYPSSKFTRSKTNPEIVRNAWSSKADKKMRNSYQAIDEIGSDEGSVAIMGGSILPNRTIVAGNTDTTTAIIHSAVERFQLGVNPSEICVVESMLPPVGGHANGTEQHNETFERVLADDEYPVKIYTRFMLRGESGIMNRDILQFQLRRKTSLSDQLTSHQLAPPDARYQEMPLRPYLVHLSHGLNDQKIYHINSFPVQIGSKLFHLNPDSHICLPSPQIAPQHCTIAQTYKGTYTIEPLNNTALVTVDDEIVSNVRPLPLNAMIKLSEQDTLQFVVPSQSSVYSDKVKDRVMGQTAVDNLTPTSNDKVSMTSVHVYRTTGNVCMAKCLSLWI